MRWQCVHNYNICFNSFEVYSLLWGIFSFLFIITGFLSMQATGGQVEWNKILSESYELAVQCVQTNYYGAKRMVEHFIPILESSDSPRIVNVSSSMGKLKVLLYSPTHDLLEGELVLILLFFSKTTHF